MRVANAKEKGESAESLGRARRIKRYSILHSDAYLKLHYSEKS